MIFCFSLVINDKCFLISLLLQAFRADQQIISILLVQHLLIRIFFSAIQQYAYGFSSIYWSGKTYVSVSIANTNGNVELFE